jgi:hypothetical protein
MTDIYTLRVLKTHGYEEEGAEELFSIRLDGVGFSDIENVYKQAAVTLLTGEGIYPWRIRDERVYTGTGAAAEFRDVIVFLAGAGAAAFTGEFAKRLASLLQDLGKKLVGHDEIGDGDALVLATLRHRELSDYAQLLEMTRNERGNRVFRFADGVRIELDQHGNAASVGRDRIGVEHQMEAPGEG